VGGVQRETPAASAGGRGAGENVAVAIDINVKKIRSATEPGKRQDDVFLLFHPIRRMGSFQEKKRPREEKNIFIENFCT
jgi:hypothetical protein